ncbi:MAG: hypothetical protein HY774_04360 [Acidobacteria bacterium]|nr:hypothetical protein [Acidobacteriota bacterium]
MNLKILAPKINRHWLVITHLIRVYGFLPNSLILNSTTTLLYLTMFKPHLRNFKTHQPKQLQLGSFHKIFISIGAIFILYVPLVSFAITALIEKLPIFSPFEFWNRLFSAALSGWLTLLVQFAFRKQDRLEAEEAVKSVMCKIGQDIHLLMQLCQLEETGSREALHRNRKAVDMRSISIFTTNYIIDLIQRYPFLAIRYSAEYRQLSSLKSLLSRCAITKPFAIELSNWLTDCQNTLLSPAFISDVSKANDPETRG